MHEGNRLMEEFRFGLVARRQPRKVFVRKSSTEKYVATSSPIAVTFKPDS